MSKLAKKTTKPAPAPAPEKKDYAALAATQLQKTVTVQIKAKGKDDRMSGVLLAYLPSGSSLEKATVTVNPGQAFRVADPKAFDGMPKSDVEAVRKRAAVCVVKVTDVDDGKVRFLTPRVQQIEWPA